MPLPISLKFYEPITSSIGCCEYRRVLETGWESGTSNTRSRTTRVKVCAVTVWTSFPILVDSDRPLLMMIRCLDCSCLKRVPPPPSRVFPNMGPLPSDCVPSVLFPQNKGCRPAPTLSHSLSSYLQQAQSRDFVWWRSASDTPRGSRRRSSARNTDDTDGLTSPEEASASFLIRTPLHTTVGIGRLA